MSQHRIVAKLDALQAEADALKRLPAETAAELDALLPASLDKAFQRRTMNKNDPTPQPTEGDGEAPKILERIVARFRKRAQTHKKISYLALVFTVFVLIGGIYIFSVAEELADARRDAMNAQIYKEVLPLFESASTGLREVSEAASQAGKDASEMASSISAYLKSPAAASLPEKFGQDAELRKALLRFLSEIEVKKANVAMNDFARSAKVVAEALDRTIKKQAPEDSQMALLARAISTRVMAVILTIFLVQLLIGLYRYNTRMAAYYDGRADALELSQGAKKEMLEILVPLLSAETIDFGKGPSSPIERAVEVTKAVISKGS
jgi:uncharacterized protein (DUF2267 family)